VTHIEEYNTTIIVYVRSDATIPKLLIVLLESFKNIQVCVPVVYLTCTAVTVTEY
jgi:hypothetical protein